MLIVVEKMPGDTFWFVVNIRWIMLCQKTAMYNVHGIVAGFTV